MDEYSAQIAFKFLDQESEGVAPLSQNQLAAAGIERFKSETTFPALLSRAVSLVSMVNDEEIGNRWFAYGWVETRTEIDIAWLPMPFLVKAAARCKLSDESHQFDVTVLENLVKERLSPDQLHRFVSAQTYTCKAH